MKKCMVKFDDGVLIRNFLGSLINAYSDDSLPLDVKENVRLLFYNFSMKRNSNYISNFIYYLYLLFNKNIDGLAACMKIKTYILADLINERREISYKNFEFLANGLTDLVKNSDSVVCHQVDEFIDYLKSKTIDNFELVTLQKTIFKNGELVYDDPDIRDKKKYCEIQMKTLYPEVKRTKMPHEYYVDLSEKLLSIYPDFNILENLNVSINLGESSSIFTLSYNNKLNSVKTDNPNNVKSLNNYASVYEYIDYNARKSATGSFAIDDRDEMLVTTTEQLLHAVQHNRKPKFLGDSATAEKVYKNAKLVLSAIVTKNMTDLEKVMSTIKI